MCDMDYYTSKLAKLLVKNGIYCLQVDIRGHGDSLGELQNVTLYAIKEDILNAIAFLSKHGVEQVLCIGRGLVGNLMLEISDIDPIIGVCAINPYRITKQQANVLWKGIEPREYEIRDIYEDNANSDTDSIKKHFLRL